jgi:hypothetical protein
MRPQQGSWHFEFCAAYVVPPCAGMSTAEARRAIRGSSIDVSTIPQGFFLPLFGAAVTSCRIGIVFAPEGGEQRNPVRDLLVAIVGDAQGAKDRACRDLACRLAEATTRRSPGGLFVVLSGRLGDMWRVVLWKFPADEALQAEISDGSITINLLRDAFSKSSSYFKAAVFEGGPAERAFWEGRVEDRQTKQRLREVADFWVEGFLAARLAFKPAHGTRVLARALRQLLSRVDSAGDRDALIAAATVAKAHPGRLISIGGFAGDYLPEELGEVLIEIAGGSEVADHAFELDSETLEKEFKVRSLMLDNQFTVKGPMDEFDDVVRVRDTDEPGQVEVTLSGSLTSEKIGSR